MNTKRGRPKKNQGLYIPLIKKNVPLPAKRAERPQTLVYKQKLDSLKIKESFEYPKIHSGTVGSLVKQHHETKNGKGFQTRTISPTGTKSVWRIQ